MPEYNPDYEEEPEIGHGFADVELYDREQLVTILTSVICELTREPEAKPRLIGFHHPPPLKAAHKAKPAKKRSTKEAPGRKRR